MPRVRIIRTPHGDVQTCKGYGYPVEEWKDKCQDVINDHKMRNSMVRAIEQHQNR